MNINITGPYKRMKSCHLQQHGWIGLVGNMLSEISQTEKDKYCIISLTCGI